MHRSSNIATSIECRQGNHYLSTSLLSNSLKQFKKCTDNVDLMQVIPSDVLVTSRPIGLLCLVPTMLQLFGTDSQKTSVGLLILLTHILISPTCILRSHSPLLHFTHD